MKNLILLVILPFSLSALALPLENLKRGDILLLTERGEYAEEYAAKVLDVDGDNGTAKVATRPDMSWVAPIIVKLKDDKEYEINIALRPGSKIGFFAGGEEIEGTLIGADAESIQANSKSYNFLLIETEAGAKKVYAYTIAWESLKERVQ